MKADTTLGSAGDLGAEQSTRASWRVALLWLGFAVSFVVFVYWSTAAAMVSIWYRSETFAHCFVVGPISIWLIWQKRKELAHIRPSPSLAFGLLMFGVSILWLLGDLAAVNAATQLAFVLSLALVAPTVLGLAVAKKIAFPLAFLIFSVPIGEFAMPLMMEWTAHFTVLALRLTGVPVYQEGLQFVIPSGNWSVVEACSGIRYLIASTVVGTLFAYLNYSSLKRRLIFVAVSILVPIVANWLRAYLIVSLGHYSGNELAVGADHLVYGWAFFGLVIIIMFMIGARWAEAPSPVTARAAIVAKSGEHLTSSPAFWRGSLLVVLVAALPHGAIWAIERANLGSTPKVELENLTPWVDVPEFADWKPAFENPSAEVIRNFEYKGQVVGVYLAYYRNQDYGSKLVSSNNVMVKSDDKTWALARSGHRQITLNGQPTAVRTSELRRLASDSNWVGETRLNVMSFYWVNGRLTTSDSVAKIASALSLLGVQGDDSALVVVFARKAEGQGEEALEEFIRMNGSSILDALQKTRNLR
jgi:exosortase A